MGAPSNAARPEDISLITTNTCARSALRSIESSCVLRRRLWATTASSAASRLEIKRLIQSPLTNRVNLSINWFFGIIPPRALLKRNIRGANENNFHARQCRCSSPEALAALASWRANLSTDLQAPRMNLGGDLKTTARRRSRTIPSTSSKLLIASRNTRLGFTSSNGVGSDSTSDGATSPATLSKSSLKTDAFSPTCAPPTTLTVSSLVGSSMSLTTGMPLMWCCVSFRSCVWDGGL